MKRVNGIWLPDQDTHFKMMMSRSPWVMRNGRMIGTYQLNKLQEVLAITKKRRVAVDIGAHVGFFSMWLGDEFREVHAFEPVPEHADCFERNVMQANVTLHRCAVGSSSKLVGMKTDEENSGKAKVCDGEAVRMVRLDDFALTKVDAIKIDVEGEETEVIAGAARLIQACRPVIMLEQNGEPDAVEVLMEMGMRVHARMSHDWIMRW